MFVLCVISTDKRQSKIQDSQEKATSTDAVQTDYKRIHKKTRREHVCLSVVSVVCCQVEVSATGRSLVQRSPTDCDVSFYVI